MKWIWRLLWWIRLVIAMSLAISYMFVVITISLVLVLLWQWRLANLVISYGWPWLNYWTTYVILWRRVRVSGTEAVRQQLDPTRPVIIVGNHPENVDVLVWSKKLAEVLGFYTVHPIIKQELMKTPFGWGILLANGTGIDRDGGEQALAHIRSWYVRLQDRMGPQHAPMIYADGTRTTKQKLQLLRARLAKKYADQPELRDRLLSIATYCVPPRAGGLTTLLQALPDDQPAQVLFVGCHTTYGVRGMWELFFRHPGPLYLHLKFETIDDRSPEAVREWLLTTWEQRIMPQPF